MATALAEDTAFGDVTSELLVLADLYGKARILAKEGGVLAGGGVARAAFQKVDAALEVDLLVADGAVIRPGEVLATVSGRVRSILTAERTALNFLQRMSGTATLTARYVAAVAGTGVVIKDTRKTTPGLRILDKYAVRVGGGQNHRAHLADGVLIKDNHLVVQRAQGLSLREIVAKAKREAAQGLTVEVEVSSVQEALEAAAGGADVIMLDNMTPDEMRRAVSQLPPSVKTEASGGINLTNVQAVAESGVNIISIGALTHSVPALDISLELEPPLPKLL